MKNAKKKALLITHAAELYDVNRAIKGNIEDFVKEHPDYDVIRLKHPLVDEYLDLGHVIPSESGIIPSSDASRLTSLYDKIVTAGGYFQVCALNTFKSLASSYFLNPSGNLEILVPMSLHYQPLFYQGSNPEETKTVEEIFRTSNYDKWDNMGDIFRKRINEMQKRAQFGHLMRKNFNVKRNQRYVVEKDQVLAERKAARAAKRAEQAAKKAAKEAEKAGKDMKKSFGL